MRPAFFFDRDGVVNVSPGAGYVLHKGAFHLSAGITEALVYLKQQGFVLVIVTSQQGVGKGLMTQSDLDEIHADMQAELSRHGASFDAIYACTCLSSDPNCTCRKPSSEMVTKAAAELNLDLSKSWLIGDHDRDIGMARNAGVPHTIRVAGTAHDLEKATYAIQEITELLPLLQRIPLHS